MEEEGNAHYALKIAVTILRERCQVFQERITSLEEENIILKSLSQKNEVDRDSLTLIDSLKSQVASYEEQNKQLQSKMKIITQENQQLWANLGKLSQTNKSLGNQLNKINDTISQHVHSHQPLIRSKTFTQEKPQMGEVQKNIKVNEKLRLDLEDVSLKLINSISEIKNEVNSLADDMTNVEILDDIITSSLGLNFEDDNEDIIEDLKIILDELNYVKDESEKQNGFMKDCLEGLKNMKAKWKCEKCTNKSDINAEERSEKIPNLRNEKMCPVCSQQFSSDYPFNTFVAHVESHFKNDVNET